MLWVAKHRLCVDDVDIGPESLYVISKPMQEPVFHQVASVTYNKKNNDHPTITIILSTDTYWSTPGLSIWRKINAGHVCFVCSTPHAHRGVPSVPSLCQHLKPMSGTIADHVCSGQQCAPGWLVARYAA